MGQKERDLIDKRLINLKPNERLFRANSGMGWAGKATKKGKFTVIENARPFHGMPEGFPDLVGFTEITVTADMVGQKIAVFTGEEYKATGRLSVDQKRWRDLILSHGGIWRKVTPDEI
jgi:hypothetical protein